MLVMSSRENTNKPERDAMEEFLQSLRAEISEYSEELRDSFAAQLSTQLSKLKMDISAAVKARLASSIANTDTAAQSSKTSEELAAVKAKLASFIADKTNTGAKMSAAAEPSHSVSSQSSSMAYGQLGPGNSSKESSSDNCAEEYDNLPSKRRKLR